VKIAHLDHLVLTVADISVTVDFYTRVLGMREVTFGNGRKALHFGKQKINLHQAGKEFEPKAKHPAPGSADLCFTSTTPIEQIIKEVNEANTTIEQGPIERTGAKSKLISVYFRNPDGNSIEISNEYQT